VVSICFPHDIAAAVLKRRFFWRDST